LVDFLLLFLSISFLPLLLTRFLTARKKAAILAAPLRAEAVVILLLEVHFTHGLLLFWLMLAAPLRAESVETLPQRAKITPPANFYLSLLWRYGRYPPLLNRTHTE
jgi:hypothetical protein